MALLEPKQRLSSFLRTTRHPAKAMCKEKSMSGEALDRFCRVFEDHGGLPITDDDLAASAVRDLVLDMGHDLN